ncbi:hypothetical protein F4779DRAFT_324880 [Xylariaceae sp. FL0662B]|nr:hypothetical protein F4779DRAFT_324880 [Xylariaceae sp. FL0662B]
MRASYYIPHLALPLLHPFTYASSFSSSSSSPLISPNTAAAAAAAAGVPSPDLSPLAVSGNTDCAAASSATTFALSLISYGNYTALPGAIDALPQMLSMSFVVGNAANGVSTQCAFALGGSVDGGGVWVDPGPSWQPCADRKDSDGTHRFAVLTGAEFALTERYVAVNQTWFCHDDEGRLVAYTGVASATLKMSCTESEVSDYHLQNCTSPDVTLPVTLL